MRRIITAFLFVFLLALGACATDELDVADLDLPEEPAVADTIDEAPLDEPTTMGEDIDLSLTRDDVDCSAESVGGSDTEFSTVHVVVDGVLGSACLGPEDATLYAAWEALATIAPTAARADLGLFGGFSGGDEGEEITLAFVNTIDDDGTLFQMSINLGSYEDDENEAYLTVAHEFSHVFNLGPTQLDRATLAEDCDTFDNGEGCFYEDALLARWVEEFWTDEMLNDFDPLEEASGEVGADRCDLNPEFLGSYAASSPDEDFAETFSAFVFDLDVDPVMEPKIDWMAQQPGLVEFRTRAMDAGLTPRDNNFELCG